MLYSELSDEQKAALELGDKWARGALVSLIRFVKEADFDLKLQYWADNVAPILATLDNGEKIPAGTDHAGTSALSKGELAAIKAWLEGINSDMESNLGVVVKAVGVNV